MKEEFISAFTALHSLNGATHLAHWNITGMLFYQLHLMFERVYGILDGQVDGLAEQGRGCGVEVPASVFNSVPEIEYEHGKDLVEKLLELANEYEDKLKDLHKECDKDGNLGFLALIEGFLTDVNTIKFLFGATLDQL